MTYHFRFERILNARRAQEHAARSEVHRANAALVKAITQRDRSAEEYARPCEATDSITGMMAERVVRELSARLLARDNREVNRAAGEAALAQLAWSGSRQRVVVLEHLDERWRARYREEEERKEAAIVDDIVAARYAAERLHARRPA